MANCPLQAPPEPWPLDILEECLGGLDFEYDTPAVVVASGVFAPVHRGHLEALRIARARLEQADYTVIAEFLSPCSDASVEARQAEDDASEENQLPAAVRFRLCELAAPEVAFTSAACWEVSPAAPPTPSWPEVADALRSAIMERCGSLVPAGAAISIFMVCDSETLHLGEGLSAAKKEGLIAVPVDSYDRIEERVDDLVLVSGESLSSRVGDLTSEMLRRAIRNRDLMYVRKNTPKEIADILCGKAELQDAPEGCLSRLRELAPEGLWPMQKVAKWLGEAQGHDKPLALLVSSGTFAPVHRGHVAMMHQARERLERGGYHTIGGWLSVVGDAEAAQEAERTGDVLPSAQFRLHAASLAVADDDFISVGAWQADEDGTPKKAEVMEALVEVACEHYFFSLEEKPVRIFFVGGPDDIGKAGEQKGVTAQAGYGVTIVPRDSEDLLLERPTTMIFTADANADEDITLMNASAIRKAIRTGDFATAERSLPPEVARFMLRPTASELEDFQADFELFRIAAPSAVAGDSASMALGAAGAHAHPSAAGSDVELGGVKEALQKWSGPKGALGTDQLGQLLRLIDPSWSAEELATLLGSAKRAENCAGEIAVDDFVDWIFAAQGNPSGGSGSM